MTIRSYNGIIQTNNEFKTITSLTNFSFTKNKLYTIQAPKICYIKIADAIYPLEGKPFQFTMGDNDIYIKINYGVTPLSILEGTSNE